MASMADAQDTPLPEPILSLSRVLIRPFHPSDAPEQTRIANDQGIAQWMRNTWPLPYTLSHAESFIANRAVKDTKPSTRTDPPTDVLINYALCRRSDGRFIGAIGLKLRSDVEARNMELGYWLGREQWGQGYGTEAVEGFVVWAFETFPETLRLEAHVYEGNTGSARVLEKAGFTREGVSRKAIWKNGRSLDQIQFSMLREECSQLAQGR